ncbi:MAG: DNA replication/repair protein RecF [Bacilli bacterium]
MIIKKIELENFRNYSKLTLNLNKGLTIFYGNNAQGKTNLLESIYLLAITKSHRSSIDNNLIKIGNNIASISGIIENNNIDTKYKLVFENKNKLLMIDSNNIKKLSDFISKINVVIFYPDDLEIIKGSPQIRRRFLNIEISQINNNYYRILNDYNRILKMRNDYIKLIISGSNYNLDYFNVLTNYLIEKSIFLYLGRKKFIEKLNNQINKIFYNICGLNGLQISYINSFEFESFEKKIMIEKMKKKINENYKNELKYKSTLFGPHKDDIEFYIDDLNLKNFGSQGQQKMAVLALKLSEIELFKKVKETSPILLLDDVFSELDDDKKNNLLSYIDDNMQAIITTTDLHNIDKLILNKSTIIKVENGKLEIKKEVE